MNEKSQATDQVEASGSGEAISERTMQLRIANEALQTEILERKRIQAEMETRVRQQEAVAAIGARALSDPSLANVYRAVCDTVTRTLDVEFCKILEAQPDGRNEQIVSERP